VEQVVAAAIEVLDEGGVAGLSMRKVAERLGTGAATLYAYVSGRDELLELVFDELIGSVLLPDPDPERWREQLMAMLRGLRALLRAHRDAALTGLGRVPTAPNSLASAEVMASVMRSGGLTDRVIALGLDQLMLYVCACAFEDGMLEQSGMSETEVREYYEEIHDFFESLPADRFPALASIATEMGGHDDHARFEFGLDAMISGLERLSARERASG
jgi:AcrR family transcriptional regulator